VAGPFRRKEGTEGLSTGHEPTSGASFKVRETNEAPRVHAEEGDFACTRAGNVIRQRRLSRGELARELDAAGLKINKDAILR
jgi:hypothetical protein